MREIKFKIITVFISIFLTGIIYNDIFLSPNEYLFSASGDGIKNYYTSQNYIKHGDLGFATKGLNYPYGELLSFTDNQPSLSWIMLVLKKSFPSIDKYVIGIYNFLMLLSISIAALFYYLIARKFYLPKIYSVCIALIIAFLSPQIERFTGHYALGYVCFVPILWYLIIRLYEDKFQWKISILIFLYNLFFGFIHPYYVLIGSLFVVVFAFSDFLYSSDKNWKLLFKQIVFAILPALFLQGIFSVFDTIIDRPTNPWGILNYATRFEGLFVPVFSPMLDWLNSIINVRGTDIESRSYVGLVGTLVFVLSIIKIVKYIRRKQFHLIFKPVLPSTLRTSLLTAILILIFAMAVPFRIGFGFLLEVLPAIKQFRSLGRFAWIFYSVFTMYASFYLYLLYRKYNYSKKKIAFGIVVLSLLLWTTEAYINNSNAIKYISNKSASMYYDESLLKTIDSLKIDKERFQAILPMPMYIIGSEVIGIHKDNNGTVFHSMHVSSVLGLEIISTMLSRSSLSQTEKLASICSDSLLSRREYINDITKKEILIVTKNADLTEGEQFVLSNARYLFSDQLGFGYYSLDPTKLLQRDYHKDGTEITIRSGETQLKEDWFYWDCKSRMLNVTKKLRGAGDYELTFWLKLTNKHFASKFTEWRLDEKGNTIEKKEYESSVFSNIENGWVRVRHQFSYDENVNAIKFFIRNEEDSVRNILIKPLGKKVFTKTDNQIFINNYRAYNTNTAGRL